MKNQILSYGIMNHFKTDNIIIDGLISGLVLTLISSIIQNFSSINY